MLYKSDKFKVLEYSLIGTQQNITEKKKLEKEIEVNQETIEKIKRKYQVLIQEANDVFEIITSDGTIVYLSDASERVIGYRPEERIGKKIFDYYKGDDLQTIKKMVAYVLRCPNKKAEGDITYKIKAGKVIYLEVHMQNLLDEPSIEGIVINFRDITRRVEIEKQMAYISTHDELTGLPNRNYFKKKLKLQCIHAKKTKTKFAVMMLDIVGFRYINDALGYLFGDQLVVKISEKLKSYVNDEHFLCRYSGDKFAIIVQSTGAIEEFENVAKSIIDLFSQTSKVDKYEIDVNISIGVRIYNEDKDIDSLIKHAEMALFWAKNQGKNIYKFYSSELNIQNYKQFELRNDLGKALENNQLRVCYQPIISLRTNEILAAEALVRWEHPNWGMVSPNEFISFAEETGFIINIGEWVFREVCQNYRQWVDKGLPNIKVSVNISSIQFFENNFIQNILNTLNEFKLEPNFLIIEITESIFMLKVNKVISDIKKLQSLGIQVALDDFGTGFSSLAYFKSFNIDILKIDGSFIRSVILDETSNIITKTIIELAEKLKIKLVAEGIEKHEQLNYLKELSCYAGQGYIYSKPLFTEEFAKVLSMRKCEPLAVNDRKTK